MITKLFEGYTIKESLAIGLFTFLCVYFGTKIIQRFNKIKYEYNILEHGNELLRNTIHNQNCIYNNICDEKNKLCQELAEYKVKYIKATKCGDNRFDCLQIMINGEKDEVVKKYLEIEYTRLKSSRL